MKSIDTALIRRCTLCAEALPMDPRPIFRVHPEARIALISQAPGRAAHHNGVPWRDQSGDRLRNWLGVSDDLFFETPLFAVVPMGFCYPGRGRSGDLPPRPECAPTWHEPVLRMMPNIELRLLIGRHAQRYYLGKKGRPTLTDTVRHYREYLPVYFPLPHPSPLNAGWRKQNPWFEQEFVPQLRKRIRSILESTGPHPASE